MIDRGDIRQAIDRCSNIWASLPGAGYGQFEHKADSLIGKIQRSGGTVVRLMHEQSHRDYLRSGYLHHRLPGSWAVNHYRDNAITAKPAKTLENPKLANAAITDMVQMRQRDVAALDAKYTKELADAKVENDALRDDVAAGRRRLHIKAVCQSVREATTASGVDNAASRLADTAEWDYFTSERGLITMQKQLEGTQKYINEQCR